MTDTVQPSRWPPRADDRGGLHERIAAIAATAALVWPLVAVVAPYAAWFAAWLSLGRPPRPSMDDPASISAAVDVVYYGSGIAFVLVPPAALGGMAVVAYRGGRRALAWYWIGLRLVLLGTAWFAAFAFIRADPWRVMDWWFD